MNKHIIPALAISLLLGLASLNAKPQVGQVYGQQSSLKGIKHSFLITGKQTILIDEDNKVSWIGKGGSRDGYVLPNGNFLITWSKVVKEVSPDGKTAFVYQISKGNHEISTAIRLENGHTMITELGKNPRLIEVSSDGDIAVDVPLQPETDNAHMQTRMARKLPNGNYLVPHLLAFAIKEYSPSGKVISIIKTDLEEIGGRKARNWPFTAIRLNNGNTLANLTNGNKTVEFDADGKLIWIADNSHVGGRFADPCGGQRLPNGNTIICSYGQKKATMPKIFELNREKEVVWEYINSELNGVHEVHVISTLGKALTPRLR